ncbi:MAG: uracil-DNA glycosylase [Gammaproteobacteria bacterium]|nr:uracil-DNA glycosylase [Gammaproteobacteria bacterium]
MNHKQRREALRALAADLPGIDLEVYENFARDWREPVLGMGAVDTPVAFFGRDPGRDEVQHQMPFIGAGGQKVRGAIYEHFYGKAMPDFAASLEVGERFFWANTVPYKPLGNKAWSMKVKKQFQPLVADLLVNAWHGEAVITLGREAFLWFGINRERGIKEQLEAFWACEERFDSFTEVALCAEEGHCRTVRLYPLPHPSPLNATWYKRFPDLLKQRLCQLKVESR